MGVFDEGSTYSISLVNLHFRLDLGKNVAYIRLTLKRIYDWIELEKTNHWFLASFISPTYQLQTEEEVDMIQKRVWQIMKQFEEFDDIFEEIDFSIPEDFVFTHSMTQKNVNNEK